MLDRSQVSTLGTPAAHRPELVRETAHRLFNLDVDFGAAPPGEVGADIRISRTAVAGVLDVRTSWSVVERTAARSRAAAAGNFLVYYIRQGGSLFRNGSGEQFRTCAGSVVIGSQDAPYKAVAAFGRPWSFDAISVAPPLFGTSGAQIRQRGFQMLPEHAPLHALLSSYVAHLCVELPKLDDESAAASLRALDHLIAGALGAQEHAAPLAPPVCAQRQRLALGYLEEHFAEPALSPAAVAARLAISPRQLHRLFEACGTSVSRELRSVRVRKAQELIRRRPDLPLTDVALGCGFDSLATFYRCFRAGVGMTASEWRHAGTAADDAR